MENINIEKLKDYIRCHLPLILGVLGIIFLWAGEFLDGLKGTYDWSEGLRKASRYAFKTGGVTILTSGVFAAVLKSFQYSGVFREEIEKVVFGNHFLERRKDLPELWKNITNAVYQSKFPDVSNDINEMIFSTYLPRDKKYYYRNFHVTIDISKLEQNGMITYKQASRYEIIPAHGLNNIDLDIYATIDVKGKFFKNGITSYKIDGNEYKLDGNEYVNDSANSATNKVHGQIEHKTKKIGQVERHEYTIKTKLTGKKVYSVEKIEERAYSIKEDNIKIFRVGTFTKGMEVNVFFPRNMCVYFFDIGVIEEFKSENDQVSNHLKKVHKDGVILPQQGWGLYFIRK
ncbi:hypothetical protein [Rufibacter latericius]|uniref:Uncharacterized protein n=1 Tax=Rufibacter latericius TaxID=2487040 RepID=A0A3M9MU82_9BACT|nr:hypothetical protein [Rufibacter latericius]RNI29081.1 hypothetical protein EFB08_06525 [Rufibacter latericius]